ncbi:MAG: hypothetical protein AB1700_00280 [Bacillota bacterium]
MRFKNRDEIWRKCLEHADKNYSGHFTLMKFTTNWRCCFGTPSLQEHFVTSMMAEGKTAEAAMKRALKLDVNAYELEEELDKQNAEEFGWLKESSLKESNNGTAIRGVTLKKLDDDWVVAKSPNIEVESFLPSPERNAGTMCVVLKKLTLNGYPVHITFTHERILDFFRQLDAVRKNPKWPLTADFYFWDKDTGRHFIIISNTRVALTTEEFTELVQVVNEIKKLYFQALEALQNTGESVQTATAETCGTSIAKELCETGGYIIHRVARKHVETGDYGPVLNAIEALEAAGRAARGRLVLVFEGYDDAPEEIYEIPEIRAWTAGLVERKPHLFYFLAQEEQNLQVILACIAQVKKLRRSGSREILLDIAVPDKLYRKLDQALTAYCEKVHDPDCSSRFGAMFGGQAGNGQL